MRVLFHRPGGTKNRFCQEDTNASKLFEIKTQSGGSVNANFEEANEVIKDGWIHCEVDEVPNDRWIDCAADEKTVAKIREGLGCFKGLVNSYVFKTLVFLSQSSLRKYLGNNNHEDEDQAINPFRKMVAEDIKKMIETEIPNEHSEFKHSNSLVDEYVQDGIAEKLLYLYTLETPLIEKLHDNVGPLFSPLFLSLDQFQNRYFQGESYRGLRMSEDDLRVYRWALKSRGIVATTTFCSTSLNMAVAKGFTEGHSLETDNKHRVLMIFRFNKKQESAINLCKLSDEQPCISVYPDEEEVLLLPFTLFIVTNIEKGPTFQTIYLENVSEKSMSFLSALKWLGTNFIDLTS